MRHKIDIINILLHNDSWIRSYKQNLLVTTSPSKKLRGIMLLRIFRKLIQGLFGVWRDFNKGQIYERQKENGTTAYIDWKDNVSEKVARHV
jgi:hypothetical protein